MKISFLLFYCLVMNFLLFFAYTVIWGIIPLIAFIWVIGTLIEKGKINL